LDEAAAADVEATMAHLNGNHADTVLLVARHLAPRVVDAELVAIDRFEATFVVRCEGSVTAEVSLVFPSTITEAHEAQGHLFEAMRNARAALDPSVPLTSLEHELQVTASLRTVHGRFAARRRVTANLLEVTLAGFAGYPLEGGDEFVYVLVSHEPGGISLDYGMDQYRDQAEGDPVRGAYYTVRRSRPEAGEIDLWVVEHDHPGSVAAWMSNAAPGEPVALWGPRHGYRLPDAAQHVLFVADETGLAAVAATIERLPADTRATAVLECVDEWHRPPVPEHPGVKVIWVDRGGDPPGSTNRLLDAVTTMRESPDAAFGAGESRHISAVRRHVREAFGLPASRVLMTGYWRRRAV
jgi:NADPH-dependent ferric siderophore reductase